MFTIWYFRNDTGMKQHKVEVEALADARVIWDLLASMYTVISARP